MPGLEKTGNGWRMNAGGLELDIDRTTGSLSRLVIAGRKDVLGARTSATALGVTTGAVTAAEEDFVWSEHPGQVTVRDDRLRHTFDQRDVEKVWFEVEKSGLTIHKAFRGAPWLLTEKYSIDGDAVHWQATVTLDAGDFRSCCVGYHIPWPQPLWSMEFWAAKDGMPSAPHRFTGLKLEYGEITSGMLMPAFCSYRADKNAGLLVAMPFDFKTPHFTVSSGYRDLDLEAAFDWMALAPGKPARTSLLLHATGGNWRPALGWLYERFKEYFEPRSTLISKLWGGHISGGCDVAPAQAGIMRQLGMTWHEVHVHFPAYGNYHPEGRAEWRSGHERKWEKMISVEMIRRTIATLHKEGIAALPYIQVSGDGDAKLLDPAMYQSRVLDLYGNTFYSDYYDALQLNSDPALPFGKDITRQIDGMVKRYPEIDGVFLDQACYNWLDTAHDDGITAVNNRPCYMTGFNYFPHLEHLSSLLHPHKVIIGNGPYAIGIMKYIDAFMAEGSGWLCDLLQYYGIGSKPMFFLEYDTSDARIERMFQQCLTYAAGFTSYPGAIGSKDLFDLYIPLLQRLHHRRWVFDTEPLRLPAAFKGNVFRGANGSLFVSVVKGMTVLPGRPIKGETVFVRTADIEAVKRVTLQQTGGEITPIPFSRENGGVQFDVPGNTVAAVAELEF